MYRNCSTALSNGVWTFDSSFFFSDLWLSLIFWLFYFPPSTICFFFFILFILSFFLSLPLLPQSLFFSLSLFFWFTHSFTSYKHDTMTNHDCKWHRIEQMTWKIHLLTVFYWFSLIGHIVDASIIKKYDQLKKRVHEIEQVKRSSMIYCNLFLLDILTDLDSFFYFYIGQLWYSLKASTSTKACQALTNGTTVRPNIPHLSSYKHSLFIYYLPPFFVLFFFILFLSNSILLEQLDQYYTSHKDQMETSDSDDSDEGSGIGSFMVSLYNSFSCLLHPI